MFGGAYKRGVILGSLRYLNLSLKKCRPLSQQNVQKRATEKML